MWELDYKESWLLKNWCFWTVVLEKTLESPLVCKEIKPVNVLNVHWKDWCWNWNSNTLAIWCEELTHLKSPWCWERLKVGGEGDDKGWDGWMVSPTQWIWIWVKSGSWWWTGRPGVLQSTRSQRAGHNWTTELNWTTWERNHTLNSSLPSSLKTPTHPSVSAQVALSLGRLSTVVRSLRTPLHHVPSLSISQVQFLRLLGNSLSATRLQAPWEQRQWLFLYPQYL